MNKNITNIGSVIEKKYDTVIDYMPTSDNLDDDLKKLAQLPLEEGVLHRLLLDADENYYFTKVNYEFKCNLAILGVKKASATSQDYVLATDHPLVGFSGEWSATTDDPVLSSKNFGELYVANVDFTVAHHLHTLKAMHFWKAFSGNLVVFYNVTILLENGTITCLNIRYTDRIRVESCKFVNNVNGQSYDPALPSEAQATDSDTVYNNDGGCIWIQGEFNEATIVNCYFQHVGKDEILGFLSGNLYPEKKEFVRRNLTVANNTFSYGLSEKDVPNHKCLAIGNDQHTNPNCTYLYQNLYIGKNRFVFTAPSLNAIVFDTMETVVKFDNARVEGNEFVWGNWTTDLRVTGIFIGGEYAPNLEVAPLTIEGNTFTLNDSVSNENTGHYILRVNGSRIIVRNNLFDATNYRPASDKQRNCSLIKVDKCGANATFIGNRTIALPMLGTIAESTPILDTTIEMTGNTIDYRLGFYCNNLTSFNLRMTDNFFTSHGYVMLAQRFGVTGSIWLSDNVWNIVSDNGQLEWKVLFDYLEQTVVNSKTIDLSFAVFTGNTFTGYGKLNGITFPDNMAKLIINERNIFPPY